MAKKNLQFSVLGVRIVSHLYFPYCLTILK